jgi:hypothetical protein
VSCRVDIDPSLGYSSLNGPTPLIGHPDRMAKGATHSMFIPTANQGSGDIPEIEDGFYVFRFEDIEQREHPDWATDKDAFGKPDDGTRFHFVATVLDEDLNPVLNGAGEDPDDTMKLELVTRTSTGAEKSNFSLKGMKGICTPVEYQKWSINDPSFDGSKLAKRLVRGRVEHSKKGWPLIAEFLMPYETKKVKPVAAAAAAE